jgi:hypothetical protein
VSRISHPEIARRVRPLCSARAPAAGRVPARMGSAAWLAARVLASSGFLVWLVACAGHPPSAAVASGARPGLRAAGPGSVFPSVQAAALDALAYAHLEARPADWSRLRVGTIRRVADGYAYSAPRRARAVSPLRTPSVRYRLRANDVARYVIPPHGVRARRDRRDEAPSSKEMQIVDDLDPRHRPVYQLTPSLKVVRYQRGGPAIAIANLSDRGTSRIADAGALQREGPSAK